MLKYGVFYLKLFIALELSIYIYNSRAIPMKISVVKAHFCVLRNLARHVALIDNRQTLVVGRITEASSIMRVLAERSLIGTYLYS